MKIHSLAIKNIRSYLDERIAFDGGKTLLQGDIGSGKSTILLGIEFALFGILRGMLNGSALLRHGAREGNVTLECTINGRHVFIKRSLRRAAGGVEQDEGTLIVNGVVQNLTPTELKVRILDLLGYPQDLLTKNKSLLYRYTVYTPQEDMKRIILESSESRLDVLRRVFDIDRYKRVQENLQPVLRALREEQRTCEGIVLDLDQKEEELRQRNSELESLCAVLVEKKRLHEQARLRLGESQKLFDEVERKMQAVQERKAQLRVLESRAELYGQQLKECAARRDVLTQELLQPLMAQGVSDTAGEKQGALRALAAEQSALNEHVGRVAACRAMMSQSQEITGKIAKLSNCPLCLQEVSTGHKHAIEGGEREKMAKFAQKMAECEELAAQSRKRIEECNKTLLVISERERENAVIMAMTAERERKQHELAGLVKRMTSLGAARADVQEQFSQIKVDDSANVDEEFMRARADFAAAQGMERDLAITANECAKREQFIGEIRGRLCEEVEQKKRARARAAQLQKHHEWLSHFFVPLSSTIEKHVFTRIYHGFNELFVQWFGELVQDESFSARLNEEFTPVIEQNGYETDIEHLSGGEKTACALAYRLALNHVINTVLQTINTRDVLILDEPTDGFSAEQLDRMREVLDKLSLGQVIIVSHERKIESFVDRVIRVVKHESVSSIAH